MARAQSQPMAHDWATHAFWTIGLSALGLGCVGDIGDGDNDPEALSCDADPAPSPTNLRRLSTTQYRRTLVDVFALVPGLDVEIVAAGALATLPADSAQNEAGPFTRMDGRLSPPHVDAYFSVADSIARAFEADADARTALVGECANDAEVTNACIDDFVDGFALRAFRRPLDEEERERFHAVDDGSHDGPELVRGLVFVALMSPEFLYHVEVNGSSVQGDDRFLLDGYALASRLSYQFWNTMPDDELFAAATDGSLLTDAGYLAQVDRIVEDARTRETVDTFYREWLRYDQVGGLKSTALFDAFADDPAILADGPGVIAAMQEEVDLLTSYYTWDVDGDFQDLLTSDLSLTTSPLLASIYGVSPWDGQGEPERFKNGERSGLLSRAAFLVTGSHQTNPVLRGAIIRRRILCQDLTPPPPSALPAGALDPPAYSPEMTTRQAYEEKTKNEPCASCHAKMNPIGFVLEQYDALGRHRTEQRMFDAETAEELKALPIDTTTVPELTDGDMTEVSQTADLMQKVAETGQVEACFARNYFRFAWAKIESGNDHCAVERVEAALAGLDGSQGPGSLREALRAIALDPSFRQRVVGPREQ